MYNEIKNKNLKTIVISISSAILCFVIIVWLIPLMPLGENIKMFFNAVTSTVGATFLVNVLWELCAKKEFAKTVYEIAQISRNIEKSGIDYVDIDFAGVNWEQEFDNTQNFTAVFTYARTWRNSNRSSLKKYINKKNTSFKVIMPDYENNQIMEEFDKRFRYKSGQTAMFIKEAVEDYINLGAEVFLFDGNLCASYYLLDDVGFMSFFSHKKGKNTVPFIRAERNGTFYTYICDEINDIKKDSVQIVFDEKNNRLKKVKEE